MRKNTTRAVAALAAMAALGTGAAPAAMADGTPPNANPAPSTPNPAPSTPAVPQIWKTEDGRNITLTPRTADDGTVTLEGRLPDGTGDPAPAMTVTDPQGGTHRLYADPAGEHSEEGATLGLRRIDYVYRYDQSQPPSGPPVRICGTNDSGTPVTVEGARFTRDANGVYTATVHRDLKADNSVAGSLDPPLANAAGSVHLTAGPTIVHDGIVARTLDSGALTIDGRPARVVGSATRTHDESVGLTLVRTGSDGKGQSTVAVPVGRADALPGQVTLPALPADAAADSLSLTATQGADVSAVRVKPGITADGSRTFAATVTYIDDQGQERTATTNVTVPFAAPARVPVPDAVTLDGILVNGRPIDGWNPQVSDYTIVAVGDETYHVSPQGRDGQTVTAGDVWQTGFATRQTWTVSADGRSHDYTVTVVRPHDGKQTAAESFAPSDPKALDDGGTAPATDTTDLKAVGYTDKAGAFHAARPSVARSTGEQDVTVPEGGTFAYRAYDGQTVLVSGAHTGGMDWTYTLRVLSPDGTRSAVHTVKATYITAATHKAELTGISFNGKRLAGFDPQKTDYRVVVGNAARYTATPEFDRLSGMAVSSRKTHDPERLTVTARSADGLESRVYTFDVTVAPTLSDSAGALNITGLPGTGAKGGLASTGSAIGGVALLALLAAAGGTAIIRRRHKARDVPARKA